MMETVLTLSLAANVASEVTSPGNAPRVLLLEHRLRPVSLLQPLLLPNTRLQLQPLLRLLVKVLNQI